MLACLYDVHGNLPALEAVLEDATDAERFVLGGDYALFGGWPAETIARLRELDGALWIRGNGERWTADPASAPDHVQEPIAASLPATVSLDDTFVCHGSPVSDVRSFLPEPAEDEDELLAGVRHARLLFGHTHLPFRRKAGGVELVNPGSVGMPFDGDTRAAYAVVWDDGRVEHRRVAYDVAASAARVRGLGSWGETIARRLERARPS
jgi:putative phosphoesterase